MNKTAHGLDAKLSRSDTLANDEYEQKKIRHAKEK